MSHCLLSGTIPITFNSDCFSQDILSFCGGNKYVKLIQLVGLTNINHNINITSSPDTKELHFVNIYFCYFDIH